VLYLAWLLLFAFPAGLQVLAFSAFGVGGLAYAALVASILVFHCAFRRRLWKVRIGPVAAMAVIAAMYFGSAWMAGDLAAGGRTREAAVLFLTLPVFFAVGQQLAASVANPELWFRRSIAVIIAGLSITAMVGLAQWRGWLPEFDAAPGIGMSGHKNHYGYACAIAFVLSLNQAGWRNARERVYLAVSVFLLVCVAISLSRGAWVVGALGIVLFLFVRRSFAAIALAVVLAVGALAAFLSIPELSERLLQDDVSSGRFELWSVLWPQTADEFLLGRGAGFMWAMTQFDVNQFGGYVSEVNESVYAHNDFLFLLVEVGIVAPLVWLSLIVAWTVRALRVVVVEKPGSAVWLAGMVMLLSAGTLSIAQSIDTVFFGSRNIYVLLGLLALSSVRIDQERSRNQKRNFDAILHHHAVV